MSRVPRPELVEEPERDGLNDGSVLLGSTTSPTIVRGVVALPAREVQSGKLAFVLRNAVTHAECQELIALTEQRGYQPALVNIGGGRQQLVPEVRNNQRCIVDSVPLAAALWERLKPHIPNTFRGHRAVGLNERLRFLRYDPGEKFEPHLDGNYQRDNGEVSFVTVQLYLNEGFDGGSTAFLDTGSEQLFHVVPEPGMVLVFQHDMLHQGTKLERGRKYALRTDVMYSAMKLE